MIIEHEQLNRHSIRLAGRDYAFPDVYFVTICTADRKSMLGKLRGGKMELNRLGRLVRKCWVALPEHFAQVVLHEFVVMPNHLHGLIQISGVPRVRIQELLATVPPQTEQSGLVPLVGAQHCCALPPKDVSRIVKPGSLGAIVRSFKAIVSRRAHEELGWTGLVWQRNYYERIIRDGKEFSNATRYIAENPERWEWERENPQSKPR